MAKAKKIDPIKIKDGYTAILPDPHVSTPKEINKVFKMLWDGYSEQIEPGAGQYKFGQTIDSGHSGWYNGSMRQTPLSFNAVEAISNLHRELKKAFKDYGERRYNEGLKDGRNCLIQLNNGDLSMDDFNKNLGGKNKHNV